MGGVVLSWGLLGFVFSRNAVTLGTGVLFGGALLALSTFSLKIWRQGNQAFHLCLDKLAIQLMIIQSGLGNRILLSPITIILCFSQSSTLILCSTFSEEIKANADDLKHAYSQQPFAGTTFGLTLWLTKKVIPTGFFVVISAAMLCFLFICNDIWRKPTTKEVAEICWCQFITRN
ncbi:hypothetical protein NC652_004861 [Populus alba x Populus x berolinensis]|nr:hypothetical protein NC652_004861 [Populus alba x Populus x berolinensis]